MSEPVVPRVDVVLCTRNRSRSLAAACEAILEQDYPPERWRLLIVDSASTDDTFAVASSLAARHPERVVVRRERRPGHSRARNAGVAGSVGDVVAFTDDDALPAQDWLRSLVATLARDGADAAGGPVEARIEGQLPPWFLPVYLIYLAIWRPPEGTRRLVYNEYPRGVNLAFRRAAFARFGLFDPSLGLRPGRPLYCEETELCLRVERGGGLVVYSPRSTVVHCVEAARLTERWLYGRYFAQGRSEAVLNWKHGGLRGLAIGSRVHRANRAPVSPAQIAAEGGPAEPRAAAEAARILTRCRRRALAGYLRQMPLAMLTVPRLRGAGLAPWEPL